MVWWALEQRNKRREALIQEGREEGRKERDELQKAWERWNSRRKEAQDKNQPFDEPPPSLTRDDRG